MVGGRQEDVLFSTAPQLESHIASDPLSAGPNHMCPHSAHFSMSTLCTISFTVFSEKSPHKPFSFLCEGILQNITLLIVLYFKYWLLSFQAHL